MARCHSSMLGNFTPGRNAPLPRLSRLLTLHLSFLLATYMHCQAARVSTGLGALTTFGGRGELALEKAHLPASLKRFIEVGL